MARTAPAPNIPPIPGMCPSVAVLAGGGDAGGGGGNGAGDGSGDNNAGAGSGGENAEGDGRGAPDYQKHPECGYASHPVDVVTGRAFTHPLVDLELPGPLPLAFSRMYSSKAAHLDMGIGFGWAHTFGWKVEVRRRSIVVWNEQGIAVDFPLLRQGEETIGPWGWVLRREAWGFAVDADDGLWHLFSEIDPRDASIHLLTAIEDRNRNRIALTYDDGRLVEVKDSAGRVIKVIQTREGRIGSIQVQNAISQGQWIAFATYTYDESGNLATATDADGCSAHYEYDEDHRLTLDQDRTGLAFHFVYDRKGRCVESWGDYPGKRDPSLADDLPKYLHDGKTRAKGVHHCKFEYGDNGYTEVADSTQIRRFFGNKHGTLDKAVEGGGVMTAVYRDDGHILSRTDAMGGKTQWERDERGRVLKVTDPLGRVTTLTRDAAGLAVEVVDAAGAVTALERDPHGNVLLLTDAAGGASSARYDARGLVTEVVSPRGARTIHAYDDQGNRISVTEANGAVWRYSHDALGRRTSSIDPLGNETRYGYSPRGDLLFVRDPSGGVTRYTYDGEGHPTQMTDPGLGVTTFVWGGYHKLCRRRDALGNEVALVYNAEGELVRVHNEEGQVHHLSYDPSGRLVTETTFDGRNLTYKNDALGRPVTITRGDGQKIRLAYDAAGQIIERELGDGSKESFEYDALGRVALAAGAACAVAFERDALGRVVRETQRVGDDEHTVESAYDQDGARVGRTSTAGLHESVERAPGGIRLRTVLDQRSVIEHERDPLERETARALPGGGRIESSYDSVGRLTGRRARRSGAQRGVSMGEPAWLGARDEGVTAAVSYGYDANGEVLSAHDLHRGHTRYEYDPIGQIVALIPEKARGEVFRHDRAGNLFEGSAEGSAREYDPGNRLLRKGDTEYAWDDDGRLIEKRSAASSWRYHWNGSGLMEKAVASDGTVVDFAYDPMARRIQKRVSHPRQPGGPAIPVALTRFVWDGEVLVHEIIRRAREAGDPVEETRTYCFEDGGFTPAAHRDGADGGWFHYLNDPAGAPERLVDDQGLVACELTRAAWGKTEIGEGARTRTPIRLQGQYEDEETGLCYNRHRYYDPDTGRFTSADPWELEGGFNVFAYAPSTLGWIDPLGLAKKSRQSGKEGATDIPGWVKQDFPKEAEKRAGESGKDVAKRLCDAKFGAGSYNTGPKSDYNKIKKYFDRHNQ